jgi:hypothetical protein
MSVKAVFVMGMDESSSKGGGRASYAKPRKRTESYGKHGCCMYPNLAQSAFGFLQLHRSYNSARFRNQLVSQSVPDSS